MDWRTLVTTMVAVALIASCDPGPNSENLSFWESYRVSIRGTVVDPSGATVPNATISITGVTEVARTDDSGDFIIEVLPGSYSLIITVDEVTHAMVDIEADVQPFIELDDVYPDGVIADAATLANLSPSKFDCGAWGQDICTIDDWEYWNGGLGTLKSCDRGLQCENDEWYEVCALGMGVCRDDDRWQNRANVVQESWAYNAMAEQRKIARFEPLHWVAALGSHNAFNNRADNYFVKPNHLYSMTDQLNMGSRVMMLDVHHVCDLSLACEIRLSHATMDDVTGIHWGASPNDRHFGYGIIEIKQWLDKNPGEVVILDMELALEDNAESEADFMWVLEHFLGGTYSNRKDYMLRHSDMPASGHWPTLAQMREMGKQVIIKSGDLGSGKDYFFSGVKTKSTDNAPDKFYPKPLCQMENGQSFIEDLITNKKRFVAIEEGRILGEQEDRGVIAESCTGSPVPCAETAEFAACGNGMVLVDFLGSDDPNDNNWPTGDRYSGLVWSWREGVQGWTEDNQAAVLEMSTGRWATRPIDDINHFACGHRREGDPSQWLDQTQLTQWRVTRAQGHYQEGARLCSREFGPDFVFSVPVNARQNELLITQAQKSGVWTDLWLAYRDVNDEENTAYWDRDVPCFSGVSTGEEELWPPNHKIQTVDLEIHHQCSFTPQCEIVTVTSNESTFTDDDWSLIDPVELMLELRAERLGQNKDGRIYTIGLSCTVDETGTVNATDIEILVPHDQGKAL